MRDQLLGTGLVGYGAARHLVLVARLEAGEARGHPLADHAVVQRVGHVQDVVDGERELAVAAAAARRVVGEMGAHVERVAAASVAHERFVFCAYA